MDLPQRVPQQAYNKAVLEEPTQELKVLEYAEAQDKQTDEDWFWEVMGRGLKP